MPPEVADALAKAKARDGGSRMIPEIGQFSLVLALCLALVQATLPLAGAATERADWMALARPAAAGQFVFIAIAFATLEYAFLNDDFSILFVAQHSNSALPLFYKFTAAWGGHEGSMLFWITVLAIWTLAVAAGSRVAARGVREPRARRARHRERRHHRVRAVHFESVHSSRAGAGRRRRI